MKVLCLLSSGHNRKLKYRFQVWSIFNRFSTNLGPKTLPVWFGLRNAAERTKNQPMRPIIMSFRDIVVPPSNLKCKIRLYLDQVIQGRFCRQKHRHRSADPKVGPGGQKTQPETQGERPKNTKALSLQRPCRSVRKNMQPAPPPVGEGEEVVHKSPPQLKKTETNTAYGNTGRFLSTETPPQKHRL